jgi:hypothetical protein
LWLFVILYYIFIHFVNLSDELKITFLVGLILRDLTQLINKPRLPNRNISYVPVYRKKLFDHQDCSKEIETVPIRVIQ